MKAFDALWKKVLLLITCIAFPLIIGFASSLLAGDIQSIYGALIKPPLAPPNWLFPIAWGILYTLMGLALYLILVNPQKNISKRPAYIAFAIQLLLNFSWSVIFFGSSSYWFAFVVIVLLDIAVALSLYLFMKIDNLAGWLLVPYMAWILFASYLNISFALLN